MARNYACLPYDYRREMKILSDEEFGKLCRALLDYSMDGTPIENLPGLAAAFAERVMMQEDAFKRNYAERCEKNRLNGAKGGRPVREEPNGFDQNPEEPNGFDQNPEKPNGFDQNRMVSIKTQKTQTKTETKTKTETENNTPYSPPKGGVKAQFSPGFDQFWAVYPKRVGKQAAWKSWSKRKCEPLTEVIISAVNCQKTWDSWTKDAGQYIPNPATWLNQGRWEDEPPELLHQAVSQKRTASDQWADLTDGNF